MDKMTLSSYYESLPASMAPKTEFVERVASRCGVKEATVRMWIKNGNKPSNPKHLEILSQETGIEPENLFAHG